MSRNNLITENTFVNGNYKTHAQYTESYMVHGGLRFSKIEDSGHSIVEARNAAKAYRENHKSDKK